MDPASWNTGRQDTHVYSRDEVMRSTVRAELRTLIQAETPNAKAKVAGEAYLENRSAFARSDTGPTATQPKKEKDSFESEEEGEERRGGVDGLSANEKGKEARGIDGDGSFEDDSTSNDENTQVHGRGKKALGAPTHRSPSATKGQARGGRGGGVGGSAIGERREHASSTGARATAPSQGRTPSRASSKEKDGAQRDSTTKAQSSTSFQQTDYSAPLLKRLPPKSTRVIAFKNGTKDDCVTLCASTFQGLLDEATAKLRLPYSATRLFLESGSEVFSLDALKTDTIVFVSSREAFRDPYGPPLPWTVEDDQARHVTSPLASAARHYRSEGLPLTAIRNGSGSKTWVIVVCPTSDKYSDDQKLNILKEECTRRLGLTRGAKILFSADGVPITTTSGLTRHQSIIVSMGEPFYDPWMQDPTPWCQTVGGSEGSDSEVDDDLVDGDTSDRAAEKRKRKGKKKVKRVTTTDTHFFTSDDKLKTSIRVPIQARVNGVRPHKNNLVKVLLEPEGLFPNTQRWELLLTECTQRLGLVRPASRLFLESNGTEVKDITDISKGDTVVVSVGEEFVDIGLSAGEARELKRAEAKKAAKAGARLSKKVLKGHLFVRLLAIKNDSLNELKTDGDAAVVLAPPPGDATKNKQSLALLLDDCTQRLGLPASARRIFVVEKNGLEVTVENYATAFTDLEDGYISVSMGKDYVDPEAKPSKPPPSTTTAITRTSLKRLTDRRPATRLLCQRNGWATLSDPHVIIGRDVRELVTSAAAAMGPTLKVLLLYRANGEVITSVEGLEKDELVYAAGSEPFEEPGARERLPPVRLFAVLNGGSENRGAYVVASGVDSAADRAKAFAQLLRDCTEKLGLPSPAKCIYLNSGSTLRPARYHLLRPGDRIRVSMGEAYIRPGDVERVRAKQREAKRVIKPAADPYIDGIGTPKARALRPPRPVRLCAFRNGLWGQSLDDPRPVVASTLAEFFAEATVLLALSSAAKAIYTYEGNMIGSDEELRGLANDTPVFVSMGEPYKPLVFADDGASTSASATLSSDQPSSTASSS